MDYDYNTQRKQLVLPEYGRNIQIMVDYCKTIEDRDERNVAANAILAVMGNLNPHLRDIHDFKHKLWDHLAIMSDFNLDIDTAYPLPDKEQLNEKPATVAYNMNNIRYKHYGVITERLIEKAIEMEDGDEKNALIQAIANHMKKLYLAWNRDSITDEHIFSDLVALSNNELQIPEGLKLQTAKEQNRNNQNTNKRKKFQHRRK